MTAGRLLFLFALGALTVLLHETFHYPLRMPGHHGLEAMALLVIGRLSCTNPASGTIVGLSTAMTALASGGEHDVSSVLLNIAPGAILDAVLLLFPSWRAQMFLLPVAVAIGHAFKPLIRYGLFESFGIQFGSLRDGLLYPLSTHLAYGFAGGLIAVLLWRAALKRSAPPPN